MEGKNRRLAVFEGNVAFRILCFPYQVGAVIGKDGYRVQEISNSTNAKIRVEDGAMAPIDSPEYVIMIVGRPRPKSRLTLPEKGEEEIKVSPAQQALIRVFEVLTELRNGMVSCRLLAEGSYLGDLRGGEDSEIVGRIRKETGCQIEVRRDNLPICADLGDALVEIQGNYLAVKKALVSVSHCLQVCQPISDRRHVGNGHGLQSSDVVPWGALRGYPESVPHDALRRTMNVVSQEALDRASYVFQGDVSREHREVDRHRIAQEDDLGRPFESFQPDAYQRRIEANTQGTLSQPRIDTHPHSMTVSALEDDNEQEISGQFETVLHHVLKDTYTPGMISHGEATNTGAMRSHPSSSPSLTMSTIAAPKQPPSVLDDDNKQVVLKILCPIEGAVHVVGPRGTTLKDLGSETDTFIDVEAAVAGCDECVIRITAFQNSKDPKYRAQRAIKLVFSKIYETGSEKFQGRARLVVPTSQTGYLLGESGCTVSRMLLAIGASIQILEVELNPKCISVNDQVVEISGSFKNMKRALYHVINNILCNSRKSSVTKSNDTYTPRRISHGEATNTGSMGFHPSSRPLLTMSTSLHRKSEDSFQRGSHHSVNYSNPVNADPYIRSEDPFFSRFGPTAGYSPNFGRQSTTPQPAGPRSVHDGSGGLSSAMADLKLERSSVATNKTVEFRVPEHVVKFLREEEYSHGLNLLEATIQTSGARVVVHEPHLGRNDWIIAVSGTPDQIKKFQHLLDFFG